MSGGAGPAKVLVVTNPFGGYGVGDEIADPAEVESIRTGPNAGHVVPAGRPRRQLKQAATRRTPA